MESRVQHLTEDKLSLARALLKSADHLTSHQEQTEWLSGQCEVWRSKFLASRYLSVFSLNGCHNILKLLLQLADNNDKKLSFAVHFFNS